MGKFATQVKSYNIKAEKQASQVFRRTSLDILRRLIVRSPVDTGRFRGNWQTGVNEAPSGPIDYEDRSGGDTISKGQSEVTSADLGDTIFIVNNLPYAVRLENGWSQQAPRGMLGLTLLEVPNIVKDAIEAST